MIERRPYIAESIISPGCAVVQGSAENKVVSPGAGGAGAFVGVYPFEDNQKAAPGFPVGIAVAGIVHVLAGGVVTAGNRSTLKPDRSGSFVNVASTAGQYLTCGIFLQSGIAGEYVEMLVEHGSITITTGGSGGVGGTTDHTQLSNRDAADQHPMSAITGLAAAMGAEETARETGDADGLQEAKDYTDGELSPIKDIVPAQATPTNKLADKDFVNSTVKNFAANYVTPTVDGDSLFTDLASVNAGPWFHAGESYIPSKNDYASYANDAEGTWRVGFDGAQFNKQYHVNEEPLTAAQVAALNSGITAALVAQITANAVAITTLDGEVVKKTGDQTIGGVKTFSAAPVIPSASQLPATPSATKPATEAQVASASGGGSWSAWTTNGACQYRTKGDRVQLRLYNCVCLAAAAGAQVQKASVYLPAEVRPVEGIAFTVLNAVSPFLGDTWSFAITNTGQLWQGYRNNGQATAGTESVNGFVEWTV